jgi:hypothetical protein
LTNKREFEKRLPFIEVKLAIFAPTAHKNRLFCEQKLSKTVSIFYIMLNSTNCKSKVWSTLIFLFTKIILIAYGKKEPIHSALINFYQLSAQ